MEAFKNTSMMVILAGIFYGAYQMIVSEPPNWQKKSDAADVILAASDPSLAPQNLQPQTLPSNPPASVGGAWNPPANPGFSNSPPVQPAQFDASARLPNNAALPGNSTLPGSPSTLNPTSPGLPDSRWPAGSNSSPSNGNNQIGNDPTATTRPAESAPAGTFSGAGFNQNDFATNPTLPGGASLTPANASLPPAPGSTLSASPTGSFSSPGLPPAPMSDPVAGTITQPVYNDSLDQVGPSIQPVGINQPMDRGTSPSATGLPPLEASSSPNMLPIQTQPVATPTASTSAASMTQRLKLAMDAAGVDIQNNQWPKALRDLSAWYQQPLNPEDREHLVGWLDRLAGDVIYSNSHTLAAGHQVQANETLGTIAARYQMPARLLARINQFPDSISDETPLQPGVALKVVPGPFEAVADLQTGQLTLYAGGLYAGRFQFRTGESAPLDSLSEAVSYVSTQGIPAQEDDRRHEPLAPTNPFGRYCLVVGQTAVMHSPGGNPQGSCLQFSEQDMLDLMVLLPRGTKVQVVK